MNLHDVFDKYTKEVSEVEEKTVIEDTGVNYDNIKNLVMNEIHSEQEQNNEKEKEKEKDKNRTNKGTNIMLFKRIIPIAAAFAIVIAAAVVGVHFLKKRVPVTPVDTTVTEATTEKPVDTGKKGSNDTWEYIEYENSVTLTKYLASASGEDIEEVVIPDEINNKPVTDISEEVFYYFYTYDAEIDNWTFSKYFVIENGVVFNKDKTTIFSIEKEFDSINYNVPLGVKKIYAFGYCDGLKSVTITDNVVSIGDRAFEYCASLTSITVTKANKNYTSVDGVLYNKDKTQLIKYPAKKADTKFTIPNSVNFICSYAFYDCHELASITIPESVTDIGEFAFSICTNLTNTTIPDNVTSIGDDAFSGCTSLKNVTIGDSVKSIGNNTFLGCKNLTNIIIGKNVVSIGNDAFHDCSKLTSIIIPNSVTSIGYGAFFNCKGLTNITLSNSITSIKDWTFTHCTSLTNIIIPNSVTSIGWCAFLDCTSLKSVTIPNNVTSIGNHAFGYNDSFVKIEGFTIYGASGSAAEFYAKDINNGFNFAEK